MSTIPRYKKIAVLKNEDSFDHQPWILACNTFKDKVEYQEIDLTAQDWLQQIKSFNPDACVLKPSGRTELFRNLYLERAEILNKDLCMPLFPSYDELRIYENKKYFAYWAQANCVPHPATRVFYHKNEALGYASKAPLPVVGKKNLGASGNGVRILKERDELRDYVAQAFGSGVVSRTGPKLEKGRLLGRLWDKLTHPRELANRLKTYRDVAADRQKGFVILQDYVPHEFEWRAVRIGNSFFAHKKLKVGDKASGTLLKDYCNPPLALLDFVYSLTQDFGFRSVAVDVFEDGKNGYLVNEIQCIFGQSDAFQMMVDGKAGRYVREDGAWIFEEGDFAANACYNLRLDWVLSHLNQAPHDQVKP